MSPQQLMALLRRHALVVLIVLALAAGLDYHIKHSDPGYMDTATVTFTAPGNKPFVTSSDLLVIDELVTNWVMSEDGQRQIRDAGGTASYNVALVNLNDEDFPNYSLPYVTVTTRSPDPDAAQKTFTVVMRVMEENLTSLQARQGAKPKSWMGLQTIASPTGPIAQFGSSKRTLVALAALALIAAFMVAAFLDRHPIRLRNLLRRRDQPDRSWPTVEVGPNAD
jgi:hypothetical protein